MNLAKPMSHQVTCELNMELWVTTSDVNLGKLVPLEGHGRLENAKIAKKYFLMLECRVTYIMEKLKKRTFQQAKNMQIGHLVMEIRPREVLD